MASKRIDDVEARLRVLESEMNVYSSRLLILTRYVDTLTGVLQAHISRLDADMVKTLEMVDEFRKWVTPQRLHWTLPKMYDGEA